MEEFFGKIKSVVILMAPPRYKEDERRRYIRLDSVFPVEFRLISSLGAPLSEWQQGFTSNIGKGGICLAAANLKKDFYSLLEKGVRLALSINIPLSRPSVFAEARLVWIKEREQGKLLLGLSYEKISPKDCHRIYRYAQLKRFLPRLALSLLIFAFAGIFISSLININLRKKNQALVSELVSILEETASARTEIERITEDKGILEERLSFSSAEIDKLEKELLRMQSLEKELLQMESVEKELIRKREKELQRLNRELAKLEEERSALEKNLSNLKEKEKVVLSDFKKIEEKKITLEKANFDKMYKWLKVHQNPRRGLISSFEGDEQIKDWAFTYDQALAAICYTYFGDYERARKLFDFYKSKAKRLKGGYLNAYYATTGEAAEYVVHIGPNVWLGIAIAQYTNKTKDRRYLPLMKEIADWVIGLMDKEGGLPGGPGIRWYSTEHNLDAYAFFDMLYRLTKQRDYYLLKEKIFNWLLLHTYDRTSPPPVKRGKGDSTIATDTYAWSIAAIGVERLSQAEMDPEGIMQFAEENCLVEVDFLRPSGDKVRVKGFDFAKVRHLPRGGVISSEWTAQMIISFKLLSEFFQNQDVTAKGQIYKEKALGYLEELGKLIISSPSPSGQGEGCLPYATVDFVDTGHGWMTPKGSKTGSVAATTYCLFAYEGFNPLKLSIREH